VTAFVTAGAAFLLAVIWFDLMFDVQVLRAREIELPEEVLASISAYYHRVTTAARPMNWLVGAVMAATLVAIIAQLVRDEDPSWAAWASLELAGFAIGLAALRTFPRAVRLGERTDTIEVQSRLARSICRDHLLCMAAIGALIAIQLAAL
jgi:hypothetical protein